MNKKIWLISILILVLVGAYFVFANGVDYMATTAPGNGTMQRTNNVTFVFEYNGTNATAECTLWIDDLAYGTKRLMVLMEHTTKDGRPKLMKKCTMPLTGVGVVDTVITNYAYIEVTPQGLILKEIAPGLTPEQVQNVTEAKLIVAPDIKEMDVM